MTETFDTGFEDDLEYDDQTLKIQALNDAFRTTFSGGRVLITPGVHGLSDQDKMQAILAIQSFDGFNGGNDPYGTHEFGEVIVSSTRIWFRIDAFDQNLAYGSPDPTDPTVTTRVMTILLPEEY